MEERYFFTCTGGACSAEFRAIPTRSPGQLCGRHDEVSAIPAEVAAYLGKLLATARSDDGLYAVSLKFSWWQYEPSNSYAAFEKNFLQDYIRDFDGRELDLISMDEVAAKMDRYTGREWIKRELAGRTPAVIKREIVSESERRVAEAQREVLGCWIASSVALAVLVGSVYLFRKGLRRESRAPAFALALAIQLSLLAIPILATPFLWVYSCGAPILLLPAVLFAWLLQSSWLLLNRRKVPRDPT
jgi:hypothetical protein